jgi:hypothetical protein
VTYLQIDRNDGPQQEGRGLRVVKATASRPTIPGTGTVVVRVRINLPPSAFRVLDAVIDVPEVEAPEITTSAEPVTDA